MRGSAPLAHLAARYGEHIYEDGADTLPKLLRMHAPACTAREWGANVAVVHAPACTARSLRPDQVGRCAPGSISATA